MKASGIARAKAAGLFQCEGGQRVEEVVAAPFSEVLKTRVAVVPDNLL